MSKTTMPNGTSPKQQRPAKDTKEPRDASGDAPSDAPSDAGRNNPENGGKIDSPHDLFHRVATKCAVAMGSPWAFVIAALTVVIWAITRPLFQSLDTWQLVINTGTTIVTFLMIFLVQNTQNRDSRAIHLKLDELLRSMKGARTAMVDLEDATDDELDTLQREFQRLRAAREAK